MVNFEKVDKAYKDLRSNIKLIVINSILLVSDVAVLVLCTIKNFIPLSMILATVIGGLIVTLLFCIVARINLKRIFDEECKIVDLQAQIECRKTMEDVLAEIDKQLKEKQEALKKQEKEQKEDKKPVQEEKKETKTKSSTKKTAKK